MSQPQAQSKPTSFSPKHSNIVLAVVMLGTMMGALDSTIVLLAFPVINDSLHSDLATSLWIILAYLLILAVATTQMGRIGDIYGRSRIFNLGFVIFTVGSALCGFSPHIYPLIAFRGVQAVGGAIMQATSGAIIADYFPKGKTRQSLRLQFTGIHQRRYAGHSVGRSNHHFCQLAIHLLHQHPNRHNRSGSGSGNTSKMLSKPLLNWTLAGVGLLAAALGFVVLGVGEFCCAGSQRVQA